MKILQICPIFPQEPWKFGSGVTNVTYHISKELVKSGHEVTVYTSAAQNTHKKMDHVKNPTYVDGIKVYHFPYTFSHYTFFITPSLVPFIKSGLHGFDVVHLHDGRSFQHVIAHHYAKKYRVPYVLEAHGSILPSIGSGLYKKIYDALWGHDILKDASRVVALTQTESDQYKSMGVAEKNITIIPNGIDALLYKNLPEKGDFRKKHSISANKKIILYLGRIHEIKGIDLLIHAYADIKKDIPEALLVIAGPDDGYLSVLKGLIASLHVEDGLLITGPLYDIAKCEAYVDADVYVLPSRYEAFPLTIIEACACGTPVVLTDRCGISSLINDRCGISVDHDKTELKNAIIKILRDTDLSHRFSVYGKKLVEDTLNWQCIVAEFENLYTGMARDPYHEI